MQQFPPVARSLQLQFSLKMQTDKIKLDWGKTLEENM